MLSCYVFFEYKELVLEGTECVYMIPGRPQYKKKTFFIGRGMFIFSFFNIGPSNGCTIFAVPLLSPERHIFAPPPAPSRRPPGGRGRPSCSSPPRRLTDIVNIVLDGHEMAAFIPANVILALTWPAF